MTSEILTIITMFVTILFGFLAKKISWFNNYLIPVQNILIGVIFMLIEFAITKDFNAALALSGIFAGGAYDVVHNAKKILDSFKEQVTGNVE